MLIQAVNLNIVIVFSIYMLCLCLWAIQPHTDSEARKEAQRSSHDLQG